MTPAPNRDRYAPVTSLNGLRIGFLYNHDEVHQVAHTAPMISPLQAAAPQLQVDVLASSDRQRRAVTRYLDPSLEQPAFYPLASSGIAGLGEKLLGGVVPLRRIGHLSANLDLLRKYDALVVPETTSTLLKTRYGLSKPKLIHMPHGAGDRSIAVTPEIAHFDFVLLPGNKTRARMLREKVIRSDNHAVIGYPKFDTLRSAEPKPLFANDRPTVVYNPHFDPKLSSWFAFGEKLLDYFAAQDRFNLIFAPHVMLFQRKILASTEHRLIRIRRNLPERYDGLDHMLIDTGSERSVDMSYTRAADIYVGDVSSQIYEFIAQSRPAILLNSHNADWRNDASYDFWRFGPVVDSVPDFIDALDRALPLAAEYRDVQQQAFGATYSIDPETPSAVRGARAIVDYLAGLSTATPPAND